MTKPGLFLDYLRKLQDDRGAMAALRRSLAFASHELGEARAYRYVEPFVQGESEWRRQMYYLLAGLYAMHPEESDDSVAKALSTLWHEQDQSKSLEQRFLGLLEADGDQLPDRLRRVVTLMRSKGTGLNYESLLGDLLRWDSQDRRVQQRWAREFYRARPPGPSAREDIDTPAEVSP